MSDPSVNNPTDERRAALRREQQQRQTRFFITFAVVEGIILAAVVVIVYVLQLIDPEVGIWLLLAVAVLGGTILSATLVNITRRNQRELEELTRN